MKLVNLMGRGPRSPLMITQGLLTLGGDVALDRPYLSLGNVILDAATDLKCKMLAADVILAGDDVESSVLMDHGSFMDEKNLWKKVIWYDFRDEPAIRQHLLGKCRRYFKRSLMRPGIVPPGVYPLDYGAMNEYYGPNETRDISIACLFDLNDPHLGSRRRQLVEELQRAGIPNSMIGAATGFGRPARVAISKSGNTCFLDYLRLLRRSRIVFTAFPDHCDGDSRTWEAFACGPLVFRDKTFIPSPEPLVNGRDFVEFDAADTSSIREAIEHARWFLANESRREQIAMMGWQKVNSFHRSHHRVGYMLRKAMLTVM